MLPTAVPTIGTGATVQPDTFVFAHQSDHARPVGDVHHTEDGWREGAREENAEELTRPGCAQVRAFANNKPVPYCSCERYLIINWTRNCC